jgi:CRP-like cAMP-binding protein
VEGEATKTLRVNEGFGELALLYEIERPSTAMAREKCGFWIIDRLSFREAVEEVVIG